MAKRAFARTKRGTVHEVFIENGRIAFTREADNLDDADGPLTILTEDEFAEVGDDDLCQRCFPRDPAVAPV